MTSVSALGMTVSVPSAVPRRRVDGPDDDLDRHERSDRVVDDHDVVVVRIEARRPLRVLSLRVRPPATTDVGTVRPAPATSRSVSSSQSGCDDDDQPVDPGGRDDLHAAQEDLLAGEPHELLGHLGPEAVAVTAGEQDRVDSHQSRLPRTRLG